MPATRSNSPVRLESPLWLVLLLTSYVALNPLIGGRSAASKNCLALRPYSVGGRRHRLQNSTRSLRLLFFFEGLCSLGVLCVLLLMSSFSCLSLSQHYALSLRTCNSLPLQIRNIESSDAGVYVCSAENSEGLAEVEFIVVEIGTPWFHLCSCGSFVVVN